jgi:hypothetical protein
MDVIVTTETRLREIIKEVISESATPAPPPQPESKKLYSILALSDFLDCSAATAQKLKNSGRIRYKQFGRKCIFDTAEVMADLAASKRPKK